MCALCPSMYMYIFIYGCVHQFLSSPDAIFSGLVWFNFILLEIENKIQIIKLDFAGQCPFCPLSPFHCCCSYCHCYLYFFCLHFLLLWQTFLQFNSSFLSLINSINLFSWLSFHYSCEWFVFILLFNIIFTITHRSIYFLLFK